MKVIDLRYVFSLWLCTFILNSYIKLFFSVASLGSQITRMANNYNFFLETAVHFAFLSYCYVYRHSTKGKAPSFFSNKSF